ncbi:MAG: MMPL family transporter [Candidatus Thermoplasmatota archaeon]
MIIKRLSRVVARHPKTIILVYSIFTVIVGIGVSNIYMEADLANYLPRDDPTILLWRRIAKEFQIGSNIIVYVEADDLRDPIVLNEMDRVGSRINKYTLDRGEIDGVFSVTSLASLIKEENAKPVLPGGLGGTGKTEVPNDPSLISRYIARIQAMKGIVFTDDYRIGVIIIQLSETANYRTMLDEVKTLISKEARYSEMTVTGTVAMQDAIRDQTFQSLKIVFPLAALFVAVTLFVVHRSFKGLIIGFIPLGYAMVLTFGVLGFVQPQLTMLSIAIVALLFGLGVDYSLYLANRFAEEHAVVDMVERVERTLRGTGKGVLICAVTTIIGFCSLMTSSMPPMVTFGFGCAIGIGFVFLSAILLVPCFCILLRFEGHKSYRRWERFAVFIVGNSKRLFMISCFFVIVSLLVLPQVKTDVNYFDMAPAGVPEIEKLVEYSKNFGGGANFNALLVETDPEGLLSSDVIDAIYTLEQRIRSVGGSAYSIADELKQVNDILERNKVIQRIAFFMGLQRVIFDKIAQKGLVDKEYSKTIILVSFPAGISVGELEELVSMVNVFASEADIPMNGHVSILVGQDVVSVEVNKQLMTSQVVSLFTALLLVLSCLIIGFRSALVGFIVLIPVLFVLAWEPGALVLFGIPLSVVNITIASIMIGTGIDYSVQLNQRVREELAEGLSKNEALRVSIETSGYSILGAASTTISALVSTVFVNIPVLHQFSMTVVVLIILSFISAMFVLPYIVMSRFIK